jgi:ATP-binding cassette subfamily B protein
MVQNSSAFSKQQLGQQLTQTLGQALSEPELSNCSKHIEILEPTAGKRFWQTADATGGIYIILAGKVRLLDSTDNLIASVGAGASFGESTLFPEEQFQPYAARASVKLRLCYIPGDVLRSLIRKYPPIREHLHHQAVLRDSLLTGANATQSTDNQRVTASASKSEAVVFPQLPVERKPQSKISRAYFPNPTVKVGQWWRRVTRRYPFFAQQSASDCGAACLVMVGRYWGKRFSVNRLRDIANVDRNGASLRGLAAAAESIGFTTRPVKASLNKLAEQSLPAIIHWEGKHYIVVYEVTRDRVIVADPAIGQRTLTHAQFKAGWTGYTLLLQPTALLKDAKEASTPFWQFFELVKPHQLVLLEVLIASVLIQAFGLITPLFTQLLLDRVVVQRSNLTLTAVGLGLLIFGLFRVAITGLRQYLLDHTANRVDLALIIGFISHTFGSP